jgi:hypothetical protein
MAGPREEVLIALAKAGASIDLDANGYDDDVLHKMARALRVGARLGLRVREQSAADHLLALQWQSVGSVEVRCATS